LNSSSSVLEVPTSLPDVSPFLFLPDINDISGISQMEAHLIEIDDFIEKTIKMPTKEITIQLPR
jgi:hypothetical protein